MRIAPDSDVKGLREVIPVRRHDAHKVSVKVRCVPGADGPRVCATAR